MKPITKTVFSTAALLLAAAVLLPRPAEAEHFDILLKVQAASSQGESSMDTTPPIGGLNKRPIVRAKTGEPIKITWRMKNTFPHGALKNVTIHFFVVREEKTGQKPVPNPAGEAGLVDNSFTMDFAPNAVTNGSLRLKISDPGSYLVRVQSENTHDDHDHEHFSAIDIEVK